MRRVVITGMGIVSSLGTNQDEVTRSLRDSIPGIGFSQEAKDNGLRSHVCGQIDLNLPELIDRKLMRFMCPASGYTYLAMKEAIDSGMYAPDYAPEWDQSEDGAGVAYKEYLYLLNFNMWEMSEFWEGQSLAPEWNDAMRTPDGIKTNNPLGYELFIKYIKPVLSKPSFTTIRSIFQDNDQGESGYVAD